jgi:tRNA A37 threonylcarbamoyladenosine modification protein TsaB
MILHIDTTEYGKVVFVLSQKGKEGIVKTIPVEPRESDLILKNLDLFLKKSKIKNPQVEISQVVILKGGGSFTGLRIAAAVAEGLGLAWGVPVKFKQKKQE